MRFVGVLVISAVAIALLTACGDGGTADAASSAGSGGSPCPQVLIAMNLVYPAPGSSGIPDAVDTIVVSGPIGRVTLQPPPGTGTAITTTTPRPLPSPIPSPNATPVSGTVTAFAVPALAPATTYTVVGQDTASDVRCPEGAPRVLGAFSTQ